MKNIFIIKYLMIIFMLSSTILHAQYTQVVKPAPIPYSFSAHGGYSWMNGVLGGELQIGHIGLAGGWMPCKMPISGTTVNSGCFNITYYNGTPLDDYSFYVSIGESTAGYRYEDTWGEEFTQPIAIVMVGSKYDSGGVYCKAGLGYGWCDQAGAFTFEVIIGFKLFGN